MHLIGYKNKKQKIVPGSLFFNLDDYSQFATKNDMEQDDEFIPEEANLDNLEPPRKKAFWILERAKEKMSLVLCMGKSALLQKKEVLKCLLFWHPWEQKITTSRIIMMQKLGKCGQRWPRLKILICRFNSLPQAKP